MRPHSAHSAHIDPTAHTSMFRNKRLRSHDWTRRTPTWIVSGSVRDFDSQGPCSAWWAGLYRLKRHGEVDRSLRRMASDSRKRESTRCRITAVAGRKLISRNGIWTLGLAYPLAAKVFLRCMALQRCREKHRMPSSCSNSVKHATPHKAKLGLQPCGYWTWPGCPSRRTSSLRLEQI